MYDEDNIDVPGLVTRLLSDGHELEWVEFKQNNSDPVEIGQYVSALANSAALHGESAGFLIWGVDDATASVVGTTFSPKTAKRGNQLLEIWLAHTLNPRVDFRFREAVIDGKHVVVLQVPCAATAPISFEGEEFIRIGSSKTKLRGHFEKEKRLWQRFSRVSFEEGIALGDVSADEVVRLLACETYFDLAGLPLPGSLGSICERMVDEGVIRRKAGGQFDITNLGAVAFARQLKPLGLERKAMRLILYSGDARYDSSKEFVSTEGYASGFKKLLDTMDAFLPSNEVIEKALRTQVALYPPLAVRELVANALIHQDFLLTGTGPIIEIFEGRVEISNPGRPLIEPQRFLDATPRSRNEKLAALLRRLGICEERGSGIDKVVRQAEVYQLPPPDFRMSDEHTVAVLYAPRPFPQMDRAERIRACYQHAGLQFIARKYLTNSSLRDRFGISVGNSAMASRIIAETLDAGLIKADDPENRSRKHARYVPYWA